MTSTSAEKEATKMAIEKDTPSYRNTTDGDMQSRDKVKDKDGESSAKPRRAAFLDREEMNESAMIPAAENELQPKALMVPSLMASNAEREESMERAQVLPTLAQPPQTTNTEEMPSVPQPTGRWSQLTARIPRVFAGRVLPRALPRMLGSSSND